MIVTFATQKGGSGKTTLAIAFANYIALTTERKVTVYDFDYQKSFFTKWTEDESAADKKEALYTVSVVDKDQPFEDLDILFRQHDSEDIFIYDLAGTLDAQYSEVLTYSNFVVTPFEYSDVSTQSTLVFINFLHLINSEADSVFIRSRYEKNYHYPNQEVMDKEISRYGHLLTDPVYKRNCLQIITTRGLTSEQKRAVASPFDELIKLINEKIQATL